MNPFHQPKLHHEPGTREHSKLIVVLQKQYFTFLPLMLLQRQHYKHTAAIDTHAKLPRRNDLIPHDQQIPLDHL